MPIDAEYAEQMREAERNSRRVPDPGRLPGLPGPGPYADAIAARLSSDRHPSSSKQAPILGRLDNLEQLLDLADKQLAVFEDRLANVLRPTEPRPEPAQSQTEGLRGAVQELQSPVADIIASLERRLDRHVSSIAGLMTRLEC
jgi:hypothetical protein